MTEFVGEHQQLFTIYVALLLALPIRDVLMPHLVGKMYNSIKEKKSFKYIIVGIVAIIIVIQLLGLVSDYVEMSLHPAIYKFFREKMMSHLFAMKDTNYSDVELGALISKIVKVPGVTHNFIDQIQGIFIPFTITTLIALGYVTYVDWKLGLPLTFCIGVLVFMLYRSFYECSPATLKKDEIFSLIMSNTDDVIRNMVTVMSFDKLGDEFDRINEFQKDYAQYTTSSWECSLQTKYVVIPLLLAFIVYACYYGYQSVKRGTLNQGSFVSVLIIIFMIFKMVLYILDKWKDILLRNGVIQHGLSMFTECKTERVPYNKQATNTDGIRFQDVNFSYVSPDMQRPVFKNFTLDLGWNETTLIVGKIGSGKSTLISLLMKYQTPQAGEIFIKGVPYSTLSSKEIRKRVCYIPQSPILLNRSVYENIVYGLSAPPKAEEIMATIKQLGLTSFLENLPKGLDTNVGVHGSKLSGGQRQIIWILKALFSKPDIIIMDEPTAAVDDSTKQSVHKLLTKVMKGKTVIMITHDPYLLKFASRVITMKEGVVVQDSRG
jgi:ABC-type multidrug transport system fused ATPase/permease subunit